MSLAKAITMEFLDKLDALPGKLLRIRVPDCRGLFIQVSGKPGNPVKSWVFRYRSLKGQGIVTIGRYPDWSISRAYTKADELRLQGQGGIDLREFLKPSLPEPLPQAPPPITVNQLIDRYEDNEMRDLAESTRTEYKRMIKAKVRNWVDSRGRLFGTRPAADVTFTDAEELLNACRRKAERTATLVIIKMTNIWDYGRDIEELPDVRNIWARQKKTAINDRDRRLSDEELAVLGDRLRTCGEPEEHVIAYQLFLLTGMRHSNLARCRWSWIDLDSQWILIPKTHHKTGKKTKKPLQVLLSTYAVSLLKLLKKVQDSNPARKGSPWLFPSAADKAKHRDDLQDPWARITGQLPKRDKRRKAPAKAVTPLFGPGEDLEVHIHDLRRTLASVLADLGFKTYAGQILGHATQGVTEVYTRTSAGPLLAMVEQAGAHIMTKMGFLALPASQDDRRPQVHCPAVVPKPGSYLFTYVQPLNVSAFDFRQSPIAIGLEK